MGGIIGNERMVKCCPDLVEKNLSTFETFALYFLLIFSKENLVIKNRKESTKGKALNYIVTIHSFNTKVEHITILISYFTYTT